jgi:hypothetical protein
VEHMKNILLLIALLLFQQGYASGFKNNFEMQEPTEQPKDFSLSKSQPQDVQEQKKQSSLSDWFYANMTKMQSYITTAREKAEKWQKYFAQKASELKVSLTQKASSLSQSAQSYIPKLDWRLFKDLIDACAQRLGGTIQVVDSTGNQIELITPTSNDNVTPIQDIELQRSLKE